MIPRCHLVIMHQPYLDRILDGTKTVESRFLSRRVAPYRQVDAGDLLLLKLAGGPLLATTRVAAVETWDDLKPATAASLIAERRDALQLDAAFADGARQRRYAVLLTLAEVSPLLPPLPCPRRDRRPWVVLRADSQQPWQILLRETLMTVGVRI